ncbi:MAG: BamA/TamA family outer membrane protein [Bacteroidaceae bacterium]|nr:BamA/TamA family outer membrane protein [Bacteroidaceae bacterium]
MGVRGGTWICFLLLSLLLSACSSTAHLPEGEVLFIGLKEITYGSNDSTDHYKATKEEVNAALQTAPNGAFFGSSYIRTPFPYGLWIWNATNGKKNAFARWLNKSFGKAPVLMSNVNPLLRSQVAENILRNNGYFYGSVSHTIIETKNPKKQKISYHVEPGRPCLIDTLSYENFPSLAEKMIATDSAEMLIHHATPFTAAILDAERNRVTKLLRDSGYYYYHPSYATYLADTTTRNGWAVMRLQMADSIPEEAQRQWYIGKRTVTIKQRIQDQIADSVLYRSTLFRFAGKKSPVRRGVINNYIRKLRHGKLYSAQDHSESLNNLTSAGLFTNVDFQFTPRGNDTLDLNLQCILDKPYNFYLQGNYVHTLSGRSGPQLKVGLTKKNAFRGGETFDVNLHAAYAWQQGYNIFDKDRSYYEFGMDASVEWPRLLFPSFRRKDRDSSSSRRRRRRSYYISPATKFAATFNILNHPGYYRMSTASAEWSYIWKPSLSVTHQLTPFKLKYQKLNSSTAKFDSLIAAHPYLMATTQDMMIPKMEYTFRYTSPTGTVHPINLRVEITESGFFTSLINKVFFGQAWNESGKTMFKNVYSQFVKLDAEVSKSWRMDDNSRLVVHARGGIAYAYGNMGYMPYTEQFYIGGANTVRAFSARSIGPGTTYSADRSLSYLYQTGDALLLFNLEYRRRLVGNLHGAVFIDAGNIWNLRRSAHFNDGSDLMRNPLKEIALGTGIGIRYDLSFLVLRLDWGIGIHAPYNTGKSSYYNFKRFKDSHTLHFAIGYPF